MATKLAFTEEEMTVDEGLGYPKAYAKLCRSPNILNPYNHGPPFAFLPYVLQPQEALRAKDLNQMFPIVDPEAVPSVNPRGYVNLLWKQLDHLGNAGFDPALFRVDPYGNVLYLHADSASPLAWDIDHWFPCIRGGRTVPSNLRILQSQGCQKKKNKLEFLVPWWDLQLGISVGQFLSIFASSNSDFKNRAFSFLFRDGGNEELSSLQAVESHAFPQHFSDTKKQVGLAPAAIVSTTSSDASVLKTLDINRSLRPNNYPLIAARKASGEKDDNPSTAVRSYRPNISKENNNPDTDNYSSNPYLSIVMARDSLRQREEAKKKQAEMNESEGELSELKQKNEAERLNIQDLEALLIKRRRRVEKCRRLAEAQSSYKALLEKMIRDAMHQSIVYKEQLRLNQAATSALMARLEAQRSICDSSENELRRKFKQRDDIQKHIEPISEQARKRSRVDDNVIEERDDESTELLLSARRITNPPKKELRKFLEEEQKASEAGHSLCEEDDEVSGEASTSVDGEKSEAHRMILKYEKKNDLSEKTKFRGSRMNEDNNSNSCGLKGKNSILESQKEEAETYGGGLSVRERLEKLTIREGPRGERNERKEISFPKNPFVEYTENTSHGKLGEAKEKKASLLNDETRPPRKSYSVTCGPRTDDDEYMNRVGKGNVEKWLQMLMESSQEGTSTNSGEQEKCTDETIDKMNSSNQQEETTSFVDDSRTEQIKDKNGGEKSRKEVLLLSGRKSFFDMKEREDKKVGPPRSESARGFRSFPSSPSMILGMRRGVDCMGRKPKVIGDDDDEYGDENSLPTINSKFIKSRSKAIKKAVNI